ncbi:prisilkin-39 [Halyomorpha halys]|uniref:prisilkin-39 n=1 Tax=Halyomorpha halys TaxID=286706 RepID=UPI0006D51285|nr:prisilkin-39-like [Halyomorpha halys]
MPSVSQLLIVFLGSAAIAAGEADPQSTAVKPTAAGFGYDVTQKNLGQWQPQYGYQAPVTGFRAGSSWPYNQDQYAYGNKNWNSGQYSAYSTAVPAYGNRYSTFGTTGYPQGNAYGNQGTTYNPAYGNQGLAYNPAYGTRYQANPALNRPINAFGSRTPNDPYNTPWLNAYGGQAPGLNNAYGAAGYRNVGYQYNTAIPGSTVATSTPKYNTFGSPGYTGYNPSSFGGTGYGYNTVGFGGTGQDYKYNTGAKQWADGRYSGDYGSQSFGKPYYQNQYTSPTYAPTNTGYGK